MQFQQEENTRVDDVNVFSIISNYMEYFKSFNVNVQLYNVFVIIFTL